MKKILFVLLLPLNMVFAQNPVTLDECYKQARENYPNLKQLEYWQEITALKTDNLKTSYLPQVNLNAQATYQSDVPALNIPIPNISIPAVSKDQYKTYAEVKQIIWDGGISKANIALEEALLKNHLSQLEVELYLLNEQVAQLFFTNCGLKKQMEVLLAQKTVVSEKLRIIESAVENGAAEKSAALVLQAEILNLEQQEVQLATGQNAALKMLSVLTGVTFSEYSEFVSPTHKKSDEITIKRPELEMFSKQTESLTSQMELLDKTRNPKIFGFGQAGFGKPGLNMLNDDFDTYFLVGVGVSWNAFNWKNTFRKKQILQIQQQMISSQQETFEKNIQLLLAKQAEEINKLEKILEQDKKLIALRDEISKVVASKLENKTITASEFIQELQAETTSKLNFELHKIQWHEATEKYRLIAGNK